MSRVVTWQTFCMILILIRDNGKGCLEMSKYDTTIGKMIFMSTLIYFQDNSGPLYQFVLKETIMKGRITIKLLKSAEMVFCTHIFGNRDLLQYGE